jgi:hypothetical protein
MIKDKFIKVKNSKFYRDLGYNQNEDYIMVDIKDLPKGSHQKIECICDYCGDVKTTSYKEYNSNIERGYINKFACSRKCGAIKNKEGNLMRFGVENNQQRSDIREKVEKTNIERYGFSTPSKNKDVKESIKRSLLGKSEEISKRVKEFWSEVDSNQMEEINRKRVESVRTKYNVDYISQDPETKNKIRETTFEKWGGFALQSPELSKTIRETLFKNWGVNNPGESKEIRDKAKQTNLERFGFEHATKNKEIRDKIRKTNIEKFGYDNIMLDPNFRNRYEISNEVGFIKYLGNREYIFNCQRCGEYNIDYDNFYKRKSRGNSTCTICYPIGDQKSLMELELLDYIKSIYNGEIISGYRDGLEIDIYLPELAIGFEFNGLYWHSDIKLDRNYHIDKLNHFKSRGIRLYMIWEDNWRDQRDIIKSQINNWLGLNSNKIGARKCEIRIINDSKLVREFLDKNHIQGFINSVIKIGLFYNNELISLMTFDQFEGRKKMSDGWNLSRFCNKIGINVVGGASKLLNYFIENFKPTRIISFADREWSDGNLYYKLGFNLKYQNKINYKYVVKGKRVNKQKFTKKKLMRIGLEGSEKEIMEKMNIYRVWDCGQLKFEKIF